MEVLGVVPARGGSKSIPRKNLAPLAGKPLLAYTSDEALRSRELSRVILDTDDEEIAAAGRTLGVEVPFLRPPALARDETLIVDVLCHLLGRLDAVEGYRPDVVVLLQPTSPLRRAEHIDAAVRVLAERNADTVVTVIPVPHQFNPVSVLQVDEDGQLRPFLQGPLITRRQDKPPVYARNGPAVLVMRREVLERGVLYGERVVALHMDAADSVDIDGYEDLVLAEYLLSCR
ncbi:MAG: cytidylyltransferase domain-containing protein [Chloroflexota bacterium]